MVYNYEKYLNVYEFPVYLHGIGKELKIRPLTTKDIKRILIYENETDIIKLEEVLDIIFKNAIIDENFNVDDLYIQDRYTLLLELRKITKGDKYSYTKECDNCKGDFVVNVDLNKINIKNKSIKSNKINLLGNKISVNLDFITRGEQKEAYEYLKNKKLSETEKMVEMILLNLAQSVKSIETPDGVDDNITIEGKLSFIENLPQKELDTIKDWYQENDFGADLKIVESCPHCGYEDKNIIEISNFFD